MSRVLFIRVSAQTYDEKDVPKNWPMTFALVWPEPMLDGADKPSKVAAALRPGPGRGVLELVDGFADYVRFADLPKERKALLEPLAQKLETLRGQLDAALGDRDVPKAHTVSNAIEDALDDTEKAVRESA